jgi:hypothetical protein
MNKNILSTIIFFFTVTIIYAQVDPDTSQRASIDRFSEEAGNLFIRDEMNNFPEPNQPINFDQVPFITAGLGPGGELISYYNFDVQPTEPAPIYVFFREGESSPVEGQLNVIDVIPGDEGYNDFWQVQKVTVPSEYAANTVTDFAEIVTNGYTIEETEILVNCPVVPEESFANFRLNSDDTGLHGGWYKGKVVFYFNFSEKELNVDVNDMVPLSPIYVTFNINPGDPGGGPPSGFLVEQSTGRTHNVTATLPDDDNYSPLWLVNIYDNSDFPNVHDIVSASSANILVTGAANVNCPIVELSPATSVESDNSNPIQYSLSQNYPNPFNPATEIKFSIITREKVSLQIFNSLGEVVAELINNELPAGEHSVTWDAQNAVSGVYFYRLTTDNFNSAHKMILLK